VSPIPPFVSGRDRPQIASPTASRRLTRHNAAGRNSRGLAAKAEECLRLSRELPNIEHKFLALGMANAWILLAEMAERLEGG